MIFFQNSKKTKIRNMTSAFGFRECRLLVVLCRLAVLGNLRYEDDREPENISLK